MEQSQHKFLPAMPHPSSAHDGRYDVRDNSLNSVNDDAEDSFNHCSYLPMNEHADKRTININTTSSSDYNERLFSSSSLQSSTISSSHRRSRYTIAIAICLLIVSSLVLGIIFSVLKRNRDNNSSPPINPPLPPLPLPCSISISHAACLRTVLPSYNLTAYIVPTTDAHNSEYVAACDARRAYISGFTGSAGTALIINIPSMKNMLWTDSRYYIQAQLQLNSSEWQWNEPNTNNSLSQTQWMIANLPTASIIGIDPSLISATAFNNQQRDLKAAGLILIPITSNLVDLVWGDERPAAPNSTIFIHPLQYSGETALSKIRRIRVLLSSSVATTLLVTALDEISWLLNLRGFDIDYNPVFFSYLIMDSITVTLYVDPIKIDTNVSQYLSNISVTIRPYNSFIADLSIINRTLVESKSRIWNPTDISQAIASQFTSSLLYSSQSPIIAPKAIKNDIEISAMKQAHIQDALAFIQLFDWLERNISSNTSYSDECIVSDMIIFYRQQLSGFVELSYPTISASGPNGAIVHYTPSRPYNCSIVNRDLLLLIDSGGQYYGSTTDTTRTYHLGQPTPFQQLTYTLVLQGHIDLMNIVWTANTAFSPWSANQPLLRYGLSYGHGTSHGIGEFLYVHESIPNNNIHQQNMVVTIEPGYYHIANNDSYLESLYPGYNQGFGIRIENSALVIPRYMPLNPKTKYYTYEPMALVPIQTKMINITMMNDFQIQWLNSYHQRCWNILAPLLNSTSTTYSWLYQNTRPISK